jgi:hypothetical protein
MLDAVLGASAGTSRFSGPIDYLERWRPGAALVRWDAQMGAEFSIVFDDTGVFVRGFDRDSSHNPFWEGRENESIVPAVLEALPAQFAGYLTDPDVDSSQRYVPAEQRVPNVTVCSWWLAGTRRWQGLGDEYLDSWDDPFRDVTDDDEEVVQDYLDVHSAEVDPDVALQILNRKPLTSSLIREVNPDADIDAVFAACIVIGYPS